MGRRCSLRFPRGVLGLLTGAAALTLAACAGASARIEFSRVETPAPAAISFGPPATVVRLAVAPVLSALPTSDLYQQLAAALAVRLGRPVELVQGKTYAEINDLIKSGDVTMALVCTNPYLQGRDDFGMELLVAPQINGGLVYYSLLVVGRDVRASSLADLRGASFAFTDPLSNSGRLAPLYQLALQGRRPDSFFSRTIFTYSHDRSIRAVAEGVVAAAAVDSLVWEQLSRDEPALADKVRVIERWGPFGINPIVVNPRLDPELKAQLRQVFLDMDDDPEGQAILRRLRVERWAVPDDGIYDSVRQMRAFVREQGLEP